MAHVTLLHGTGGSPNSFWFPWLSRKLEENGHSVWSPQLPNADAPSLEEWLPFVLEGGVFAKDSILVGHSAGCPLILSMLEVLPRKIAKAVLVAGFAYPLEEGKPNPIIQEKYDWERIRENVGTLVFINSDDDPWGCGIDAGRFMFDRLGGTLIIRHGEGHMGSEAFQQPYKEFPLLRDLIESESW